MANCKNCGNYISSYLHDYGYCSDECRAEYEGNSTTVSESTAPSSTDSPSSTSPSNVPTTDPATGEEIPRYLANDTYKGHKLSVKPGEVETVISYLGKSLVDEINNMKDELEASKVRVDTEANLTPVVSVPADYTAAYDAAAKAISNALEEIQESVDKVKNIADAICQYGDGGWATPYSVLKHLNEFLGLTGGGGGDEGGDGGGLTDDENLEANETETTIPDNTTGNDDSADDLNTVDEEIVISSVNGSDEIVDGEIITPDTEELGDDDLTSDSELADSTLTGFSSLIVPSTSKGNVTETKSAGLLGAVGLAAAAAVALGGKIYYDVNKEKDEDDEYGEESDETDIKSSNNSTHSTNKDMLQMKKNLFNIGSGGDE